MAKLRLEEVQESTRVSRSVRAAKTSMGDVVPKPAAVDMPTADDSHASDTGRFVQPVSVASVDHWKRLAISTGERLQHAENQAKDLRQAADEARARFHKYKERLDKANERINELQVQLVQTTAERDDLSTRQATELASLRAQLAKQENVARRVHQYRQSLLDGPIWDLFAELVVVSPADTSGVEKL